MMRAAVFISLGALTAQAAVDEAGFRKTVVPFLESYCLDCHDNETVSYTHLTLPTICSV